VRRFDRGSFKQARAKVIRFVGLRTSGSNRRAARTLFRSPFRRLLGPTPFSPSFGTIFGATSRPSRPRSTAFLRASFTTAAGTLAASGTFTAAS
jgi:hypothetical protein